MKITASGKMFVAEIDASPTLKQSIVDHASAYAVAEGRKEINVDDLQSAVDEIADLEEKLAEEALRD